MRSPKARRGAAALAVVASASLLLAACGGSSGGSSSAGGSAPGLNKANCAPIKSIMTQYGDLTGKNVHVYTSIVAPEDQRPEGLVQALRGLHRRHGPVRGLERLRGAAAGPRQGRQRAGHRRRPAARPAHTLVNDTGKVVEPPRRGRGQRRQVLGQGLEELRHGRRQVLRRPAGREREVARVVLAEDVQGQGLHRPDHLGRPDRAVATRSRPPASKPWCAGIGSGDGDRLAGHRLARGGRAAPRTARTSTTSGSPTRSSSTTRRSPTRWTRSARS